MAVTAVAPARSPSVRQTALPQLWSTSSLPVLLPQSLTALTRPDAERLLIFPVAVFRNLESVSHPRFGDEIARVAGVRFELPSNLGNEDSEIVGFLPILGTPHVLEKLSLTHQFSLVPNQNLDHPPFRRREL